MRPIRGILTLLITTMVIIATTWTQPAAAFDVYTTPGQHRVNGREWRTTCEPYSQTMRCRTEIQATQVTQINGRFVPKLDWYFNNLTYVESPRALWKGNPLGNTGSWTSAEGRTWRTECDTPTTGGNGCRSYTQTSVIESYQSRGSRYYRWTTKSVFNNIVRFKGTPPATILPTTIKDVGLRTCVTDALGISVTTPMPLPDLARLERLSCGPMNIQSFEGMPALPKLAVLDIYDNPITTLKGLPDLPRLTDFYLRSTGITSVEGFPQFPELTALYLYENELASVKGLPSLPKLKVLQLQDNQIAGLAEFPSLPQLTDLDMNGNQISSLTGMPVLPRLTEVDFSWNTLTSLTDLPNLPALEILRLKENQIATLDGIPVLTQLRVLWLSDNPVTKVAPLAGFTGLRHLYLDTDLVTDLASLAHLVDLTIYDY